MNVLVAFVKRLALCVLKPVGEVGHVERGDAQNVEQALRAPVFEQGLELEVGGRRVEAHDGVRDVDLVLLG